MKPNEETGTNDEQLRSVLRHWTVNAPLPPRFQEQVWRRIERTEVRPEGTLWARALRLIALALPRPAIAVSYVTLALMLGLTAGSLAAQVRSNHLNTALSERYVRTIDPYRAEIAQP